MSTKSNATGPRVAQHMFMASDSLIEPFTRLMTERLKIACKKSGPMWVCCMPGCLLMRTLTSNTMGTLDLVPKCDNALSWGDDLLINRYLGNSNYLEQ
jgi:hypothetical protein